MSETSVVSIARPSFSLLHLLIITSEEPIRDLVYAQAEAMGLGVESASSLRQALGCLERLAVDIVVADLAMPTLGGIEFVKRLRAEQPETTIVVLTELDSTREAQQAIQAGAAEWLSRPLEVTNLRARLERVARSLALGRENRVLREQLRLGLGWRGLVGASPRMQHIRLLVEKISRRDSPVLILGETGTGKELVARAIHFHSARRNGPFVPVDCTSLAPTLVESELFGYLKGAFTGADQNKPGLIESASGGTLFLDEIGELPLEVQAKLLRVLQEKQVRPVGGISTVGVDLRVIAATNRNLQAEASSGRFRQDLFFRLNVVPIQLPPLRERRSDIPLLVSHFLERYASPDRPTPLFSEEAMVLLLHYEWPGNVRELENAVARALALNSGPYLTIADLPTNLRCPPVRRLPLGDESLTLAELERRAIFRALQKTGGDKATAARLLGIGRTTLYRKLKEYGDKAGSDAVAASDELPDGEDRPSGFQIGAPDQTPHRSRSSRRHLPQSSA